MKKILVTLLLIPFLMNSVEAAISIQSSISPTTIYPGDEGIIVLTLTPNTGYASVTVNVPSTELSLSKSSVSIGAMLQNSARSATFGFTAPDNSGFYTVSFSVRADTETYNEVVAVHVQGEPKFSITKKTPEKLYAGEETNLTLTLKNTGYKNIEKGVFTLAVPNHFAVLDSSEKTVNSLGIDQEVNLSFNIRIDRDIDLMSYPMSLAMQSGGYLDYENFSMPVIGEPSLELAGISMDPAKPTIGSDLTLAIRLENLGTARARSVDMELTNPAFSGIKVDYVGSIDPDDISSAIFELVPIFTGTHTVDFTITYLDDSGNSHSIQKSVDIPIYEAGTNNTYILYLTILALVVVVIFLWRKKK